MGDMTARQVIERTDGLVLGSFSNNYGVLNEKQAEQFIDWMGDDQVIMKAGDTRKMTQNELTIDTLNIAARQIRLAVEATAPTNWASIAVGQNKLICKEVILPVAISYDVIEENIEREGFVAHLMKLIAYRFGNDLEDLAVNGNEAFADQQDPDYAFYRVNNGFIKLAKDNCTPYNTQGNDNIFEVVDGMLRVLDKTWRQDLSALRLYCSVNDEQNARVQYAARQTTGADNVLLNATPIPVHGVQLVKHKNFTDGTFLLTRPKNCAIGIRRAITVEEQRIILNRQRLFVVTAKVDFNYALNNLVVVGYNQG